MDFDDLLNRKLKPFGRYQRCMVGLIGFSWFVSSFNVMGITFLAATPKHHCKIPFSPNDVGVNVTEEDLVSLIIPQNKDGSYNQCKMYRLNASAVHLTHGNSNHSISELETVSCDSYTYDDSQYKSSVVTKMNLVCENKDKVSVFYTVYVLGMMVSGSFYTYIIDLIGRKPGFMISSCGAVIFTVVQAFVGNYHLYCVMRFCLAVCEFSSTISGYVLALELVGPAYRTYVGTYLNMMWTVGYMFAAGVAYAIRDYVTLQLTFAAVEFGMVLTFCVLPESPRWLVSRGRVTKADKVCKTIARWNDVTISDEAASLHTEKMEGNNRGNPVDIFKSKYLRKITLILFVNWISVTFVYYAISWNTTSLGGDDYLNFFLMAAVEFPAHLLNLCAMNLFGRRLSLSVSMLVSGALLLSNMLTKDLVVVRVTLAMLTKFLITAAFTMLFQYTNELYPTNIRAVGFGYCNSIARIGGLISSNFFLLANFHPYLPTIILALFPVLSGSLALLLPETKGRSLPQVTSDVEILSKRATLKCCCDKEDPLNTDIDDQETNQL